MNPVITVASHWICPNSCCKAVHPSWTKQREGCMSCTWPRIFHPFVRSRAAHPVNHKRQPVDFEKSLTGIYYGLPWHENKNHLAVWEWVGFLVILRNIIWFANFSVFFKQRKCKEERLLSSRSISQRVFPFPAAGKVCLINDPGWGNMKLWWSWQEIKHPSLTTANTLREKKNRIDSVKTLIFRSM